MDAAAISKGGGAISGSAEVEAGAGTTALAAWFCCTSASSANAADPQPMHPMSTHKNHSFRKKNIFRPNSIIDAWSDKP